MKSDIHPSIAPTFRWGTERRKNTVGFSPKHIPNGTIYKTPSGFFIDATLLPGLCPSLCYFSPLGKRGVMQSYISVYPLIVNRFLIYEQGTPVFDFGTAQSWQIIILQSLIGVRCWVWITK